MEGKPTYAHFPHPKSPSTSTQLRHRPRHSIDHTVRTSLDPRSAIDEPPHPPPAFEATQIESPILNPIHSLYNPQLVRPSSRQGASEEHERQESLDRQLRLLERPLLFQQDLSLDRNTALDSRKGQAPLRTSSLKDNCRPPQDLTAISESPPRPSTAQGMYTGGPSLTLRAYVPTPSSSSSISLSKPPILSPTSTVAPGKPFPNTRGSNQAEYNKTPYFHSGIGGRGNYRKVKREDKGAPLAYAPNAGPLIGRSKFLSNLFWGRNRRKMSTNEGEGANGRVSEDSLSCSRGSSEREEVALGAAEVIRRKLLRQAGVKLYRKADPWEKN